MLRTISCSPALMLRGRISKARGEGESKATQYSPRMMGLVSGGCNTPFFALASQITDLTLSQGVTVHFLVVASKETHLAFTWWRFIVFHSASAWTSVWSVLCQIHLIVVWQSTLPSLFCTSVTEYSAKPIQSSYYHMVFKGTLSVGIP